MKLCVKCGLCCINHSNLSYHLPQQKKIRYFEACMKNSSSLRLVHCEAIGNDFQEKKKEPMDA